MPHPGQGKPVNILKGQRDCSLSKFPELFCSIKKGTISVTNTQIIPNILFFINDLIV